MYSSDDNQQYRNKLFLISNQIQLHSTIFFCFFFGFNFIICMILQFLKIFLMSIPDDPSVVQPIYNELKENTKTFETRSIGFRKKALGKLLDGYVKLQSQFDEALKKDLGLNSFMANFLAHAITLGEIKEIYDSLQEWVKPQEVKTPIALGLASSSIQHQPLGLVLVISAWNYPIYTALPLVAAAIAAGNSVILKPSEFAPYTSNVLAKLFNSSLNPKYYRCIQGKVEVAKAVSKLPLDMVCFTGSTATGKSVALEAAKNLTPCLLQLGGKCPVIVDQSANIDSAVLRILFGKLTNCGQTCVGADHVYVHEKILEKFKKQLIQKLKEGYKVQQIKTNGDYAKIIHEGHVQRLSKYINQDHKGTIVYQGVIDKQNRFISPFVIQNPSNDSLLMTEEIFGPILPLKPFKKLDVVIEQINSRAKPLVVYVFSEDKKNIKLVKDRTTSGSFVVNDVIVQLLSSHLPFGGVGGSGYGRYHGYSGFQQFSNARSICQTKAVNMYPLSNRFAPYTDSKKRTMSFLLKVGGITYEALGKGFKYALVAASGIGLYVLSKNFQPKL